MEEQDASTKAAVVKTSTGQGSSRRSAVTGKDAAARIDETDAYRVSAKTAIQTSRARRARRAARGRRARRRRSPPSSRPSRSRGRAAASGRASPPHRRALRQRDPASRVATSAGTNPFATSSSDHRNRVPRPERAPHVRGADVPAAHGVRMSDAARSPADDPVPGRNAAGEIADDDEERGLDGYFKGIAYPETQLLTVVQSRFSKNASMYAARSVR